MKTDNLKTIWRMVAFLAAFSAVSFAAVVPGTPQEVFLRSHPQQSSAPEGIVYQVPDDKLEPGKLYHDASTDGNTRVTRHRVVGRVRSGDTNAAMNYDIIFRYESKRGQSTGKLKCIKKKYKIGISQPLSANEVQTANNFDLNVGTIEKNAKKVLDAHENQHATDLRQYPVMFYFPAGDFRCRMSAAEESELRRMIQEVENGYVQALKILEGRAVKAEVDEKKKQIDAERKKVKDGSQPLHSLFDLLFLDGEKNLSKQYWAAWSSEELAERCVRCTAKTDIKDRNDVSIGITYEKAYEAYRNENMETASSDYEKLITGLYQYFHNLQYKYDPNKTSINTKTEITGGKVGRIKNDATYAINNFYEWLVEVERVLGELPQACAETPCKDVGEAAYFAALCYKNAKKDDKASAMAYRVMYLRNMATPMFVGGQLLDKELFIKSTEKKADVLERFISLISCNFNDNPLIEFLACVLVEEFPVGGHVYKTRKNHAIFMNNGEVPKSEDTPTRRPIYKWNHYRQDILNALKKEYMEQVDGFRRQAKRAAER